MLPVNSADPVKGKTVVPAVGAHEADTAKEELIALLAHEEVPNNEPVKLVAIKLPLTFKLPVTL
jgi:hypothetical protein